MTRIEIRDTRSCASIKPRVLDVIIHDDGTQEIEVKDGKRKKSILLSDMQEQIRKAQNNR